VTADDGLFLGVDVGTSAIRISLVRPDTGALGVTCCSVVPVRGRLRQVAAGTM